MPIWSGLVARLHALLHRNAVADEIREELEFHVRMRAEEYERAGATPEEARRRALYRVGNLTVLRERGYDVRGGGLMETISQDLRYGLRLLWRHRGFSTVAVLTLALGIGLSTALASVLDAALVRPLPYSHPEQLVRVGVTVPQRNGSSLELAVSADDIRLIRQAAHDVTAISMFRSIEPPIAETDPPERLDGEEIDDAYLGLYGVTPFIGRGITAADLADGSPPVLLLGYDYWQRHYGGSPAALGQTIRFDDGVYTIVGVLPKTFRRATPIWRPLRLESWKQHLRGSGASVFARVRPGVTRQAAQSEITNVLSRLPGRAGSQNALLSSLLDSEIASRLTTEEVLAGAVGLILLIACVNVAGLLLTRGTTRHAELALRASLGANRGRLVRQLLTESVLLAAIGGLIGVVLAAWTLDTLVANIPISLPQDVPAALNARVLGFAATLSVATGILFGLAPALRLSRLDLATTLARSARGVGSTFRRSGSRLLIATETALALILLMGAGLMLRSITQIFDVDLGFRPEAIVTLESAPVASDPASYSNYYTRLVYIARSIPGVAAVGAIDDLPLSGSTTFMHVTTEVVDQGYANIRRVLPGYFEAMGLAASAGRLPTDADLAGGRHVVVLNQSAAQRFFAKGQAVGRPITVNDKDHSEVIGVVPDIRYNGPIEHAGFGGSDMSAPLELFQLYRPEADQRPMALIVVVRPTSSATNVGDALRQAARQANPNVLIERLRPGEEWLDRWIRTPRQITVLLTLLGALGLVLTLVGVFGMTAYTVARRTQEIGVRMAFGAQPGHVVRLMLNDAAVPVGIGLALGAGGAFLVTRVIASFLFQTTPRDPATFAAVIATLAATAIVAAWVPARRAARVDPLLALRAE